MPRWPSTRRCRSEGGPSDERFQVFPPQALVPPGQSQAVRLQYIGNPSPPVSEAYVLNISQVPVVPPGASGITVVYRFGVAIYVNPKGAVADPALVSARGLGAVLGAC